MKQKYTSFWYSLDLSMIHLMFAIWSYVPLPFLNPACSLGISLSVYGSILFCRILSKIWLALVSHANKILLKFLQKIIETYMEREMPNEQAGFRKGKVTHGQIANISWIMERSREYQKEVYFCFIDYLYFNFYTTPPQNGLGAVHNNNNTIKAIYNLKHFKTVNSIPTPPL